ncbi:MAG: DUF2155 domain-containing protein [Thermodesulfovibrionales bacterium]|nr:DUF2155 domain-containing protein [Thermodesulfovibrionales bacterium]
MKAKFFWILSILLFLVAFGCESKKEPPPQKSQSFTPVQKPIHIPLSKPQEERPQSPHGSVVTKSERKIVVPPDVQKKWSSVRVIFEDRQAKRKNEYTIKLNTEFHIEGTNLKVICKDFLPDFKMEKDIITSRSNEPNNPAVRAIIYEKDKAIFNGWLYSKYPDIHAFEHPRYSLVLKEGLLR